MQAVWKPLTVPFLPLVAVVLLTEQLSMALSACLPIPLFCCGEPMAAAHQQQGASHSQGNGTKRFLLCLRFAASNVHRTSAALLQPLPLNRMLGPCQGGSLCCWSEMYGTALYPRALHCICACLAFVLCCSGNKVGRTRVVSLFVKRDTLQKLASVCRRSGASREWLHVGFF